jgi:hypothetical protein
MDNITIGADYSDASAGSLKPSDSGSESDAVARRFCAAVLAPTRGAVAAVLAAVRASRLRRCCFFNFSTSLRSLRRISLVAHVYALSGPWIEV